MKITYHQLKEITDQLQNDLDPSTTNRLSLKATNDSSLQVRFILDTVKKNQEVDDNTYNALINLQRFNLNHILHQDDQDKETRYPIIFNAINREIDEEKFKEYDDYYGYMYDLKNKIDRNGKFRPDLEGVIDQVLGLINSESEESLQMYGKQRNRREKYLYKELPEGYDFDDHMLQRHYFARSRLWFTCPYENWNIFDSNKTSS